VRIPGKRFLKPKTRASTRKMNVYPQLAYQKPSVWAFSTGKPGLSYQYRGGLIGGRRGNRQRKEQGRENRARQKRLSEHFSRTVTSDLL